LVYLAKIGYVIVRVHFDSVFTNKRPKSVNAARAHGVLMVKILNKSILSIFLVYNLFYRQTAQYFHTPVSWAIK